MDKFTKLSERDQKLPYAKYINYPYPPVPPDILDKMKDPINPDDALRLENLNDLLKDGYLPGDIGYCRLPDGAGYVATITKFVGCTREMFEWWFAWHGLEALRYRIWDPQDHYIARDSEKHIRKRLDSSLLWIERIWDTCDHIYEDTGAGKPWTGRISFYHPEKFGFDMEQYSKKPVTAVCCTTSESDDPLPRSTFVHFARDTDYGFELRSHFWLGYIMVNRRPVRLEDVSVSEQRLKGLSIHSPFEFTRLASILADVYRENVGIIDSVDDLIPYGYTEKDLNNLKI